MIHKCSSFSKSLNDIGTGSPTQQAKWTNSFGKMSSLIYNLESSFLLSFCLRKIIIKELWRETPAVQQYSVGRDNVTEASLARHG